ncbi:MAG: folate family ECF transporter S component [Oscillospiraceae bacterium]|nr:folate family ECF transporter S component [Oscillospiraceae bacterium]
MKLSKTKRLAADAMLAAMFFVLSLFSINLPGMKITLDSLPILVAAMLLGPLDGLAVGLVGSFLNQMITYGFTATTLLWILPAGLRGLLVGLYAKRHAFSLNVRQMIFITVATALLVTALNTLLLYIDSWVYSYSYIAALPTVALRIAAGIITAVVFSLLLPTILSALRRALGEKDEPSAPED